ncbi:helix-hairpin-helix domain-containing protein [Rhodobacter sp. NSM]|uniref:helix-hairpin-helix domain-containing protein n=1 Tax=Rhodobacter sp. NSM TaxID=3457501 RepID=UPI003FCFCCC7
MPQVTWSTPRGVSAGAWITAAGTWINDRTHGLQLKARFLKAAAPSSLAGIERFLGSGMIRGIGPVYVKRLVQAFGKEVFDIIEAAPDRLREVGGIGPPRAAKIIAGWADQKATREIMVFLRDHGVGTARIYKTCSREAVEVMTANPYRLAGDIRGIGFRTADIIAGKLGIEPTAKVRVRTGIAYALTKGMGDGQCGLPMEDLTTLAGKLLEMPGTLAGHRAHETTGQPSAWPLIPGE